MDLFLTNMQHLTSQDVNWRTGVMWIIVMFLSAVWTLILTAPIHCRASICEQVMEETNSLCPESKDWQSQHTSFYIPFRLLWRLPVTSYRSKYRQWGFLGLALDKCDFKKISASLWHEVSSYFPREITGHTQNRITAQWSSEVPISSSLCISQRTMFASCCDASDLKSVLFCCLGPQWHLAAISSRLSLIYWKFHSIC